MSNHEKAVVERRGFKPIFSVNAQACVFTTQKRQNFINSYSGKTISIWMTTAEVPEQPVLTENTHADVCVVGAGIAGMLTALR
ncbi:hypothetical protein LC608_00410 [Nostoc sp. XA010]|uniref:hypothetical protein n=1 Tax=Nostoc sp. XA010 TaxID=2780407 RepID=UPI001E2B4CF2|nr:hypothetical protein [Nostoc sp. XA010]MCC5655478.1 hypothetical protein [Nostoc sp. XA010]